MASLDAFDCDFDGHNLFYQKSGTTISCIIVLYPPVLVPEWLWLDGQWPRESR